MLISFLAPILGTCIVGIWGRLFGRWGGMLISVSGLGISFIYSWWILFKITGIDSYQYSTILFPWFSAGVNLYWVFVIDEISAIMLVVVSTVSFIVHIYSIAYMRSDPHSVRFFTYLSLFTIFMFLLVLGDNLIYFIFRLRRSWFMYPIYLINFWFTRLQANKAALKAMIVNRVGDLCFIAAVGLLPYFLLIV